MHSSGIRTVRCSSRLLGEGLPGGWWCIPACTEADTPPRGRRSAGVRAEVNLKNPTACRGWSTQESDPPWFWNPGLNSPEVQNRVSVTPQCPDGGVWPGGVSALTRPLWTESQTLVKTLPCRNYVADGNNIKENFHFRFRMVWMDLKTSTYVFKCNFQQLVPVLAFQTAE